MNDPGLDDPIGNNAEDVDESKHYQEEPEEEAEEDYLVPSRWWFFSTAFPLVAGTFGPMANAFSVCALVQNWRVEIPPMGTEAHGIRIADPKWLIAVNAVSLIFALIANIALLLQMARRVSATVAQPVVIVGWYLASFLLIALVAVASSRLRLPSPPDHALTQAFYYGIMAAALYFIIASLMVVTAYGALKGHYKREFKLTTSQRTLMLQTICFLVYILLGALVYSHIEGWEYLDAVYFADVTVLTVGTGDYTPMTHLGRSLEFPFAIGGIVFVGLVIGSIRALVLERGKKKMSARMIEKCREKALRRLDPQKGTVKVNRFKKRDVGHHASTEKERRRQEFHVMRDIQHEASVQRKWISLALSASCWFALWFIGAAVFFRAEKNQGWSYFQSLYYAYISLLTIGYGDFRPFSNSGKPFFVFWSLLAVPTMTVLISNMGDTIIQAIKDVTLWIGSWTVLPDEGGFRETIRRNAAALRRSSDKEPSIHEDDPGGFSGEERVTQHQAKANPASGGMDRLTDTLGDSEEQEARKAFQRGDLRSADRHHYHFLIIKEMRTVMGHLNDSPPKKYSFDEWAWYLKLMGENEADPDSHRSPITREGVPRADGGFQEAGMGEKEDGSRSKWSWLGKRSPLMGHTEEAEWVLDNLASTLEKELKRERQEQRKGLLSGSANGSGKDSQSTMTGNGSPSKGA